jgi:SAM-dependent methyltransferase
MRLQGISCPVCDSKDSKRVVRRKDEFFFLSCSVCSFSFIYPSIEDQSAFNDYAWTKDYTENYDRYLGSVVFSLREKVRLAEQIMRRKVESFLDIGCGNGLYLHAAGILGLENLGQDIDKINIEFAQKKGLNARATPFEDLDVEAQSDFVHLKSVLHLASRPIQMMKKAKSLAAPGGVIYIEVPNQGSPFSFIKKLRDRNTYGQLELPLRRGAYNYRCLKYLCDKLDLTIAKRVYPHPGDRVYYPILGMKPLHLIVFRLFSMVHISSLLGVYVVKEE